MCQFYSLTSSKNTLLKTIKYKESFNSSFSNCASDFAQIWELGLSLVFFSLCNEPILINFKQGNYFADKHSDCAILSINTITIHCMNVFVSCYFIEVIMARQMNK